MSKTYCYLCKSCGAHFDTDIIHIIWCEECDSDEPMIRNYRAEGVTINKENIRAAKSV